MKINSINNNINFGYNKELNDTVNKKLEKGKGNKEVANHLLEMNQLCLKTEDLLRKAEKEKKNNKIDVYSTLLLSLKPALTEEINKKFPHLKYKELECESYKKEAKERNIPEDEYHWLEQITDEISEFSEFMDLSDPESYEGVPIFAETHEKATATDKKDCPDILEQFTPTEISPDGFSSVGGMTKIKQLLDEKILLPLREPELAKLDEIEYGKKYPRGTMFYGPPGCGKTTIFEALTAEAALPMYKLKISKAGSEYVNGSAKNIQQAYDHVCKVAEDSGKPVFFVIDELESITSKRKADNEKEDTKMVGTLLQIIEEARGKNIIVLGATNKFDMIDEAIRSRFDDKIYVGLPDDETRESVLKIHLNKRSKGKSLAENPEELEKVVALTKGFSNRDIAILTDKASLIARKDGRRDIVAEDFVKPVQENQNMKIKEAQYKDKQTRPSIGFNK